MLQPKRTTYRKMHKGKNRGIAWKGSEISFGSFALKALENVRITSRQIESARIAMTRHMKREGAVWFRIFPDKPVTKKPQEVRMGKGKGAVDHWVALVQPGRIMFELEGVTPQVAKEALELAAQKLPLKCAIVTRHDYIES